MITKKDRAYMEQLFVRNAKLLRMQTLTSKEYDKQSHMGLSKPMSNKERQRRLRFKKKAAKIIYDLTMLQLSGVLPIDFDVEQQVNVLRETAILTMAIPDDGSSSIPKLFPKIE